MAGQSVRVIDIEADAEMNMGIFTKLPQGRIVRHSVRIYLIQQSNLW